MTAADLDTQPVIPGTVKGRLALRQCVVYVGAGFSAICGMPTWAGLIAGLLTHAEEDVGLVDPDILAAARLAYETRDYSMCGSLLRSLFSASDMDEEIRSRFSNRVLAECDSTNKERMNSRLLSLVRGPWAGIVTTNYDGLIEHGLSAHGVSNVTSCNGGDARLGTILGTASAGGMFFVKIHGSVAASPIVFSTEDYDRTYLGSPRMTSFLTALMLRYHLVFIGCSLEDEMVRLRRRLSADFDGLIPSAYALMPDNVANRLRKAWLSRFAKIDSVLYANEDGDHLGVDTFLKESMALTDRLVSGGEGGSMSTHNLRELTQEAQLQALGHVNRELLTAVANSDGGIISHFDLVALSRNILSSAPALADISAEERVYRALYLVSVGLLRETIENGCIHYFLPSRQVKRGLKKSSQAPASE